MKHERAPRTDVYRFRRVKWGSPRHKLNRLRNVSPATQATETSGAHFWVTLVVTAVVAFAGTLALGTWVSTLV